jgi:hypothetical protein
MSTREKIKLFPIIVIISAFVVLLSCSSKNWIEINNGICKIYDPDPVPGQVITWDGKCKKKYAQGYGILSVYEDNKLTFRCEGNANHGYLSGFVIFSIYKEEKIQLQYEDTWYKGRLIKRERNVTLDKFLAEADDVRQYLFLLKKYKKQNPNAWIDAFHKALLEKTVFACKDMEVNTHIIKNNSLSQPGAPNGKSMIETGKVYENELLLKIYSVKMAGYVYYTVYNHRVGSLKELSSDLYHPRGKQF